MVLSEVENAVREAEMTMRNANQCVSTMAGLIAGKLRSSDVWTYTLDELKKELRDYNMHTGCWKEK